MKKVLIFTSEGGGGHVSVSNALKLYLKDTYNVSVANIFSDILESIDPIQSTTKIIPNFKTNGESLYNFLMRNRYFQTINALYAAGNIYFNKMRANKIQKILTAYLQENKPDLIISVIPIINSTLINVAKNLQIPLLLIPTDLDARTFITDIQYQEYYSFTIGLSFDNDDILNIITSAKISPELLTTTGFPIRPDFFEEKNIAAIKEHYSLPQNKPIILLIMGAQGTESLRTYAEMLRSLSFPAHIIFCLGKNKTIKSKLESLSFSDGITTTMMPFTERISDLMASADLLITKSGSVSVCEAIYANLPMLLDATTSTVLRWEQFNHELIMKHNFGNVIKNTEEIKPKVCEALGNLNIYKQNLMQFKKKNPIKEIQELTFRMIHDKI